MSRYKLLYKSVLFILVLALGIVPSLAQEATEAEITLSEPVKIPLSMTTSSFSFKPLLTITADGALLATAGRSPENGDRLVQVWDATSGAELAAFEFGRVEALAFSPTGRFLGLVGQGGNLVVLDVETLKTLGNLSDNDSLMSAVLETNLLHNFIILPDATGDVFNIAFSGDESSLLVYNDFPPVVSLWDIREALDPSKLAGDTPPPNPPQITFDYDGETVRFELDQFSPTTAGFSALQLDETHYIPSTIQVDAANGEVSLEVETFNVPRGEGSRIVMSADANSLLLYTNSGAQVYHQGQADPVSFSSPPEKNLPLVQAALSADGTLAAAIYTDGEIVLWDVAGTEALPLFNWTVEQDRLTDLAFAVYPQTLVAVGRETVYIWTLSGERIVTAPVPLTAPTDLPDAPATTCMIDLSPTVALLVQAQAAATAGDSPTAVQLMTQVREQLSAFEAQCSSETVETPPAPAMDLPMQYTVTYSRDELALTFNYPADWLLDDSGGRNSITITNAEDKLDALNSPEPPTFSSDEVALNIGITDVRDYGGTGDLGNSPSAEALVRVLLENAAETLTQTGDIQTLEVNGRPAAQVTFTTSGGDGLLMMIELANDDPYRVFGHIILLTASEELAMQLPLVNAVAASFTVGTPE